MVTIFGWGCYVDFIDQASTTMQSLQNGRYNGFRYWALARWKNPSSSHRFQTTICDALVAEAAKRNIYVMIEPEHNYPPSKYINGYVDTWINDLVSIGRRYNGKWNVKLECINEYTGTTTEQMTYYNRAIAALRAAGITLPLHFTIWWTQSILQKLTDRLNRTTIGRHHYGQSYNYYSCTTPTTLTKAANGFNMWPSTTSGKLMYSYFNNPNDNSYHYRAQHRLGVKYVVTELGPTFTEVASNPNVNVDKPSKGNMTFSMAFLQNAKMHDVDCYCYRHPYQSTKSIYEGLARSWFGQSYAPV